MPLSAAPRVLEGPNCETGRGTNDFPNTPRPSARLFSFPSCDCLAALGTSVNDCQVLSFPKFCVGRDFPFVYWSSHLAWTSSSPSQIRLRVWFAALCSTLPTGDGFLAFIVRFVTLPSGAQAHVPRRGFFFRTSNWLPSRGAN